MFNLIKQQQFYIIFTIYLLFLIFANCGDASFTQCAPVTRLHTQTLEEFEKALCSLKDISYSNENSQLYPNLNDKKIQKIILDSTDLVNLIKMKNSGSSILDEKLLIDIKKDPFLIPISLNLNDDIVKTKTFNLFFFIGEECLKPAILTPDTEINSKEQSVITLINKLFNLLRYIIKR